MGSWSNVGKSADGSGLPLVKFGKDPVRLRVIKGDEGTKYEGPEERWQHWPPESEAGSRAPVLCIGQRQGCIFHSEPLMWQGGGKGKDKDKGQLKKDYLVNVVVYEMEGKECKGRSVQVLKGNKIFQEMFNQAQLIGQEPDEIDFIIKKEGEGLKTTYTVSTIANPKTMIEPQGIDFSTLDPNEDFGDDDNPILIDFDKFEGYKHRTPKQQQEWFEARDKEAEEAAPTDAEPANGKIGIGGAAPAAKPQTPPPAAPKKAAPPAAPAAKGPSAAEIAAAKKLINSWSDGAAEDADMLNHVLKTDGFSEEYTDAATMLLGLLEAPAAPAAPPPAPKAAAPAATGGDMQAKVEELGSYLKTLPCLKNFKNMSAFFGLAGPNKKALKSLTEEDLDMLLPIAREGDEAVLAAINAA